MTKDFIIPDFKSNWISLRQLLKVLKEKDIWTLNTKYLNIASTLFESFEL